MCFINIKQMQKLFINGVPYFTDKGNLYLWDETNPTHIGTYTDNKITYQHDLISKLSTRLTEWRAEQSSRVRKPTATASRKNRNNKATVTEDSENDA